MNQPTLFDLPNEMLYFIVNKLDLPDLLRSRSVCRRLKIIIDNLKKKSLVVIVQQDSEFGSHNYFNMKFDFSDSFLSSSVDFEFMKLPWFKQFFANLKTLSLITSPKTPKWNLDILNEFLGLEKLSISSFITVNEDNVLDLPNLRQLTILENREIKAIFNGISSRRNNDNKIFIKSKVVDLELNLYFNLFELEHPDAVLSLTVSNTERLVNFTDFSNLKTLTILNYKRDKLNLDSLKAFRNLEELFINDYDLYENAGCDDYEDANNRKKRRQRRKKRFDRYLLEKELGNFLNELNDLKHQMDVKKVYFWNIELVKSFEDYKFEENAWNICPFENNEIKALKLQLLNYELLSNKKFCKCSIDYLRLMNFMTKNKRMFDGFDKHPMIPRLPANFFQRFNNIRIVWAEDINDENEFLSFLGNCNFLLKLTLMFNFSQSFLDSIPSVCGHSLIKLNLWNSDNYMDKEFEFFLKLNYIQSLSVSFILSFDFVLILLKRCRRLTSIRFESSNYDFVFKEFMIPPSQLEDEYYQFDNEFFYCLRCWLDDNILKIEANYDQLVGLLNTKDYFSQTNKVVFKTELKNQRPCFLYCGSKSLQSFLGG